MTQFRIATRSYIDGHTNKRPGETKLGEKVQCVHSDDWEAELKRSDAKFVLLGIPEDIGVRANYGLGGAHTLWEPALKALLNVQHTDKLQGDDLLVLGAFDFRELMQASEHKEINELRELVAQVDEAVHAVVHKVLAAGKIPLVIGGGHNNSYPLLHAVSDIKGGPVNCINLDAHSDYRMMEGRHSGNGFRYAKNRGYLDKYAVIGLHENYNAQDIVAEFATDYSLYCSFYEDIFLRNKLSYDQSIRNAIAHTSGAPTGIELDLDCIEYVLSSAATPCGISSLQARQYINSCAGFCDMAYLHIAEGATKLRNGKDSIYTPKLVAYLLTDLLKA
jgi:formiminoglutamase